MTKFIDFPNFKFQKSSQFIVILALTFRVTMLIQQIFISYSSTVSDTNSDNSVSSNSFSIGHTKIPLFFPNMDISIAIREDVRKNASVKKSGSFVKYSRCNSTLKF